jgi:hypothetical protein
VAPRSGPRAPPWGFLPSSHGAAPTGQKSSTGNLSQLHPPTVAVSILGPEADPNLSPAEVALAEVRAAARTDWRAAAWLVERDPETREIWSDPARAAAIRNATIARVLEAIEAANLGPVTERLLLLEMTARGVGRPPVEAGA